jgi:hypothetical protein
MTKLDSGASRARDLYATAAARRNYPTTIARITHASRAVRRAMRPGVAFNERGQKSKPTRFDGGIY